MSKYNSVLYNWTEITNRLLRDKQELAKFLRFSAAMYKQRFSDAALIYQQNPKATKVATLEMWNKLGRYVNKGEHSIAAFGEDSTCRHLFDITQTNGRYIPQIWKLDEELASELTTAMNEKHGRNCRDIHETIAAAGIESVKARLPEVQYAMEQIKLSERDAKQYQQSVVSAVRFVISNRCELDSDMKISGGIDLNVADKFKDTRDLVRFCDIVSKSAKESLLEIEREVIRIIRLRRERLHELQTQPDRTVQRNTPVYGRSEGTAAPAKTDRKMGQTVAGMDENRTGQNNQKYIFFRDSRQQVPLQVSASIARLAVIPYRLCGILLN